MSIVVTSEQKAGEPLQAEVEEDLHRFDLWFQKTGGNDPLVRSEKAILKTYLYWKTQVDHAGG